MMTNQRTVVTTDGAIMVAAMVNFEDVELILVSKHKVQAARLEGA